MRLRPPPFPYQDDGANFLAARERAGLFDEMGLGKTRQLIMAADRVKARRILIICPAAARAVWVGEFEKWAELPRKVLKMRDVSDLGLWLKGRADVLIMSYEQATKHASRLAGDIIDLIIFDEAHYLKNPDAARTRALLSHDCDGKYGLARWACYVWFASGTPNPNDAADFWSIVRFCGATRLTCNRFKERYYSRRSGAYSDRHTPLPEMLAELQQVWKAIGIKRKPEDVGLQLPPLFLTTTSVDGDTAEIRNLLRAHPGLELAILEAVEQGGLSELNADHIATLQRLIGEAKAPAYVELIREELASGLDKVVIFGRHKRALEIVRDGLAEYGVVRVDGDTSESQRVQAVKDFQHGQHRICVANIVSGGTALTLTRASRLDLFEYAWSPAVNQQAIKRIHRIGQERACHARMISLLNSIDATISEVAAHKTSAIGKVGA